MKEPERTRGEAARIVLQRRLRLWPRHFCLITGAPRTGTTALAEWLAEHPDTIALLESRTLVAVHRFLEQVQRFKDLEQNRQDLIPMARFLACDYYRSREVLLRRRLLVDKEPLEPIAFPDKQYQAFLNNVRILFPVQNSCL